MCSPNLNPLSKLITQPNKRKKKKRKEKANNQKEKKEKWAGPLSHSLPLHSPFLKPYSLKTSPTLSLFLISAVLLPKKKISAVPLTQPLFAVGEKKTGRKEKGAAALGGQRRPCMAEGTAAPADGGGYKRTRMQRLRTSSGSRGTAACSGANGRPRWLPGHREGEDGGGEGKWE